VKTSRRIALCFLLCFGIWLAGLLWFTRQIPDQPLADSAKADAIVILTGGAGRLEYGLKLLSEARAKKLFISGVSETATIPQMLNYAKPDVRAKLAPVAAKEIVLGHKAVNTIGNASETARWLRKEEYNSIILVTTSYHMPRSTQEFTQVAPGLAIIPAPVFPEDSPLSNWLTDPESRGWLLSEYHKYLAAELRHWLVAVMHRNK